MTEPNDKMLNRVRGLLDKAASTQDEFPAEAKALQDKAMELMATYSIERAVLEATGQKVADTVTKITITFCNPFSYEKHNLLRNISYALGCKTLCYKSGKSVTETVVVGHSSDLERIEFLYTLLLVQAESGAAKLKADSYNGFYTPREVAAQTRGLRAAYLAGFGEEIGDRLTAITAQAAARNEAQHTGDSAPGAALVLTSRKELVDQKFRELFPKTKLGGGRVYNGAGWAAGQAGGRNADLGQDRFGTRGKALAR